MPNGNAERALDELYRPITRGIDRNVFSCATCHTLPTGLGPDSRFSLFGGFEPLPAGPSGERHHSLVSVDGSSQRAIKVAQLRNMYDKVGFEMTQKTSRSGFGFLHDGSVDSLARFLSEEAFEPASDQEVADLVALMMAFTGSEFGPPVDFLEPPGTPSQDVHASVGQQITLAADSSRSDRDRANELISLARKGAVDLVVKATFDGEPRGWVLAQESSRFRSDEHGVYHTESDLLALVSEGPLAFTIVPGGTGVRVGIDRDRDGILDFDETRDLVPEDPGKQNPFDGFASDTTGDAGSLEPDGKPDGTNDFDNDGVSNGDELLAGTNPVDNLRSTAPLDLEIVRAEDGSEVVLRWMGESTATYNVEYSANLVGWTDSPGGYRLIDRTAGLFQWIDKGPPDTSRAPREVLQRFYRVVRVR